MPTNPQDYPLSVDSYVNFDGDNIKEALKNRLTALGIFTDQNYEGSNLAHFNEILAYLFSMLLFMLNKQSNEGMFTEAQLYENINKIVRGLDYKPIGYQTATLSFKATAQAVSAGLYKIPRYSYVDVGGVRYSFNEDIIFSKTVDDSVEILQDMSREKLLYQGTFVEHSQINASGNSDEIIFLSVPTNTKIDHFNIDVYIKDAITQKWSKWEKTSSLYLNKYNQKKYEIRLNENKRYEIKFGNDINGKKLNRNDLISIYYLKTDGSSGEVGSNVLVGKGLSLYNSTRFSEILSQTSDDIGVNIVTPSAIRFTNSNGSSYSNEPESISSIKRNAPGAFRSQYRVVTELDYETFIKTNFSYLVSDVKVMNNTKYLDSYMRYFTELGLLDSQLESRALFNQVNFADSCNFNNVYLFTVPKTAGTKLSYINPAQKQLIIDTIKEEKVLTSETVILDPVYLAFDLCLGDNNITKITDRNLTKLIIQKTSNTRKSDDSIKVEVINKIKSFFKRGNTSLGQTIDLNKLTIDILGIDGVNKIFTYRSDLNIRVEGLRFLSWNPAYGDISTQNIVSNTTISDFQFPYLVDDFDTSKVIIESNGNKYEGVET